MKQLKQLNPRQINTTALAYIGDAVYEIYVREHVLAASGGNCAAVSGATSGTTAGKQNAYGAHVDALHRRAIRYARAEGQAKAVKVMLAEGFLTAEEEALVRRARNHKSASKPKNADAMDYKYATAFEALIGFWHLMARCGDSAAKQRAEEIIFCAFAIIEGAAAPQNGRFDESLDYPKISDGSLSCGTLRTGADCAQKDDG